MTIENRNHVNDSKSEYRKIPNFSPGLIDISEHMCGGLTFGRHFVSVFTYQSFKIYQYIDKILIGKKHLSLRPNYLYVALKINLNSSQYHLYFMTMAIFTFFRVIQGLNLKFGPSPILQECLQGHL